MALQGLECSKEEKDTDGIAFADFKRSASMNWKWNRNYRYRCYRNTCANKILENIYDGSEHLYSAVSLLLLVRCLRRSCCFKLFSISFFIVFAMSILNWNPYSILTVWKSRKGKIISSLWKRCGTLDGVTLQKLRCNSCRSAFSLLCDEDSDEEWRVCFRSGSKY